MPKWFARLFALVMVLACAATAWYAYQHEKLSFAIEDVRVSLETSQARERKQQYEYDQVSKALPEARLELSEIQPKADAAKADESALRETRKTLRSANAELTAQLEEAETRRLDAEKTLKDLMADISSVGEKIEAGLSRSLTELVKSLPEPEEAPAATEEDGAAESPDPETAQAETETAEESPEPSADETEPDEGAQAEAENPDGRDLP